MSDAAKAAEAVDNALHTDHKLPFVIYAHLRKTWDGTEATIRSQGFPDCESAARYARNLVRRFIAFDRVHIVDMRTGSGVLIRPKEPESATRPYDGPED